MGSKSPLLPINIFIEELILFLLLLLRCVYWQRSNWGQFYPDFPKKEALTEDDMIWLTWPSNVISQHKMCWKANLPCIKVQEALASNVLALVKKRKYKDLGQAETQNLEIQLERNIKDPGNNFETSCIKRDPPSWWCTRDLKECRDCRDYKAGDLPMITMTDGLLGAHQLCNHVFFLMASVTAYGLCTVAKSYSESA